MASKAADRQRDEQRVAAVRNVPAPKAQWTKRAAACELCTQAFGAFTRHRHHCRQCGKCVCGPCSQHSRVMLGSAAHARLRRV